MKSKLIIIVFIYGLFSSTKVSSQLFNVDPSLEGMSNTTLRLNDPFTACPQWNILLWDVDNIPGHHDGQAFPHDKEKQKNHTQGDNWARSLRFIANFHSNCSYNFAGGNNPDMLDWNKLMFIMVPLDQKFTSVRLGWRFSPAKGKIELGLYSHIRHVDNGHIGREFFYINEVALGVNMEFELILAGNGVGVIAGGKGAFIKRNDIFNNGTFKTAFKKNAYFGGQECPPHDMDITVININGDHHSNWEQGACEKTFGRSIFESGENFTIEASTSITMSEQVYRGQYDISSNSTLENTIPAHTNPSVANRMEIPWFEPEGERFVKIKNGSNIVTRAGSEITLLPGFEAENGSNFEASIANWLTCATWAGKATGPGNDTLITSTDGVLPENPAQNNNAGSATSLSSDKIENNQFGELGEDIKHGFSVLPNPTSGEIQVKLNTSSEYPASILIVDVLGRVVAENTFPSSYEVNFDLNNIPQGVYIVKANYQNSVSTKRIIKN